MDRQTMSDERPPLSWLWLEIARLYGKEAADSLHKAYNEQNQRYQKARIAEERARRIEERRDLS